MSAIFNQQDSYQRWQAGCQKINQEIEREKTKVQIGRLGYKGLAAACFSGGIWLWGSSCGESSIGERIFTRLLATGVFLGGFAYLEAGKDYRFSGERYRFKLVRPEFVVEQKICLKTLVDPADCYSHLNDLCDAGIITPDMKEKMSEFAEMSMSFEEKINKIEGYGAKILEETASLSSRLRDLKSQKKEILEAWSRYRDSIIDQIPNPLAIQEIL